MEIEVLCSWNKVSEADSVNAMLSLCFVLFDAVFVVGGTGKQKREFKQRDKYDMRDVCS